MENLENLLSPFYMSIFQVNCYATGKIKIPGYKGFALRDAFLAALAAYSGSPDFSDVPGTIYSCFYKASVPDNNQQARAYEKNPPAAFIVDPVDIHINDYMPGESFSFQLTLFGKANQYLEQLPEVLNIMGENGLGSKYHKTGGRGQFRLISIKNIATSGESTLLFADGCFIRPFKPEIINYKNTGHHPLSSQVKLSFIHPVMLFYKDRQILKDLGFEILIKNILNRILLLSNVYCEGRFVQVENIFPGISNIETSCESLQLRTYGYSSSRQQKSFRYKSIKGEVTYKGDLSPWTYLLNMGSKCFVGRNTSSGFGKYIIMDKEPES